MSYRVTYGKELPYEKSSKRKLLPAAVFVCVLTAVGSACYFWQQECMHLTQALFPWTRPEVRQALSALFENIGQGSAVADAVFAFCREILHASKQMY